MTTQLLKRIAPSKRVKPNKKSSLQTARVKKRTGKRSATRSTNGRAQPSRHLRVTVKPLRPLASFAGIWANDETFDEFIAAMTVNRKAVDADASQP